MVPLRLHILKQQGLIQLNPDWVREILDPDFKQALMSCNDDYTEESINKTTGVFSEARPLPYFTHEPFEYRHLLNYMLVNWPCMRDRMCSTPSRRAELRSYAESGI